MEKNYYNSSVWTDKSLTLSVLIPTRDMMHSYFSYCLIELVKANLEAGVQTNVFYDMSTVLLNQRSNLAKKAIESNSDYMLWLDSDMMYPSTTALRLLGHNKDVVACNYMKRSKPLKTVAYTSLKDWESWLPLTKTGTLEEVEGVGMGCMLIKTSTFKKLNPPFFTFPYDPDLDTFHGEDFELCRNIRKLGTPILIDMDLSVEIKHLGTFSFGEKLTVNKNKEAVFKIKKY